MSENVKAQVMISVPPEMKVLLDDAAKQNNLSTAAFCRKYLAEAIDYDLPATSVGRGRKYATIEERIAAQAARAKERNDLVKKLLAEHRATLEGKKKSTKVETA